MEEVVNPSPAFWSGRSVLLTGHTGFKGAWLALWLSSAGAKVHGYAIDPPTDPNLFHAARIASVIASDTRADLADNAALKKTFERVRPEVVFHLAAQPLVRTSYQDPIGTFATNVMGTANVLEAARTSSSLHAIVIITTDKVYENRNWEYPYREIDALGGRDPYSASKAAAELIVSSYRSSFFSRIPGRFVGLATARAGNVVGGGDWATDRLVPDCIRAFQSNKSIQLRYPKAVRPWQHVLEPLSGYIRLAEKLKSPAGAEFATAWNFGPDAAGDETVGRVAAMMGNCWGVGGGVETDIAESNAPEASLLRLDSTKARTELEWMPRWTLDQALSRTVDWHREWTRGGDMLAFSLAQIEAYESKATA